MHSRHMYYSTSVKDKHESESPVLIVLLALYPPKPAAEGRERLLHT